MLPDSDLLLEGISFTTSGSSTSLMSSPLPLTLESQRNRSLRLIQVVDLISERLKDLLDDKNAVRAYVHPDAQPSLSFFESSFCSGAMSGEQISDVGVRIGLGDSRMSISSLSLETGFDTTIIQMILMTLI